MIFNFSAWMLEVSKHATNCSCWINLAQFLEESWSLKLCALWVLKLESPLELLGVLLFKLLSSLLLLLSISVLKKPWALNAL